MVAESFTFEGGVECLCNLCWFRLVCVSYSFLFTLPFRTQKMFSLLLIEKKTFAEGGKTQQR